MVVIVQNEGCDGRVTNKKCLIFTTTVGISFLFLLVLLLFIEPLIIGAKYYLRVANGSIIHELMTHKIEGPRIYLHLFNITNAEEFMSGKDEKLKLQEVGPFVYQEYRINNNLVINDGVMRFTPEMWTEFIPEESYGDPEEVFLTMPGIPMLAGAGIVSKYSFVVRNMFNMLAASMNCKAIVKVSVHNFLWGYYEPLLSFANNLAPGLIYYNSSGLLSRLYDDGASYTLEYKIREEEKFCVKSAKKFRVEKNETAGMYQEFFEYTQNFTDAYEGAVFPPELEPGKNLNIFRHSVCKTFPFSYTGLAKTQYGSEAFSYDIANSTLNDRQSCDSTGWCPSGLMDISDCYNSFPFAISRGHFLHSDPRLLDKFEGLKPDLEKHSSQMIIDPRLGVTLDASISVQLSLVLGDVGFNRETRRFKDMFLPVCHTKLKHPRLPLQADSAFRIIYIYGPYILIGIKLLCIILALGLLGHSIRMFYCIWTAGNKTVLESKGSNAYMPLRLKRGL